MRRVFAVAALLLAGGCQALVGIDDLSQGGGRADAGVTGWQIRHQNPYIYDVLFANNLFVAVGSLGFLETSPDGITWTTRPTGTSFNINTVVYGNGRFVAQTGTGTAVISTDGLSWQTRGNQPGYGIGPIAFGNGKFIGSDGGDILSSTDGVTGWLVQSTLSNINHLYFANGLFVITLYSGGFLTSPDGTTWTPRNFVAGDAPHAATFGAGVWVAVGETHTGYSADGLTWTPVNNVICCFNGVTYSGTGFFAVGRDGHFGHAPANGQSWTTSQIVGEDYAAIAYGGGHFVAGGATRAHSADGSTWTQTRTETASHFQAVATSDGATGSPLFVAVGDYGKLFRSTDGITWERAPVPTGRPQFTRVA